MLEAKVPVPTIDENYGVINVGKRITLPYSADILIVSSVIIVDTLDINPRGVLINRGLAMRPY
ncbi:MAG: hypothetical protein AB2693_27425 [Candidatus Thiodiazotropha sp.]